MDLLVHTLLSNALAATFMAVIAAGLAWIFRRPAFTHSLWLLVMLKLVTPPFVPVSLPIASLIPPIESSLARSAIDHDANLVTEREPQPHFDAHDSKWADIDEISSDSQARSTETEPDFAQTAMPQPGNLSTEGAPLPSELKSGWSWEPLVLMVILAGAVGWWTLATVRIIRFQGLLKDVRPAPRSGNCTPMNWPSRWAWLADRHYSWYQAAYLRCSGQLVAGHGCWCLLNSGRGW